MSEPTDFKTFPGIDAILKSTASDVRYMLIHNSCKKDIYPQILAYDFSEPPNPLFEGTIPSGFKLAPGEFKLLKLPRYVNSGRISARTLCTSSANSFSCITGNCPLSAAQFASSKGGVLCGTTGALAPATIAEFTFDTYENDYYDISQVDGNNLSVTMIPMNDANNYKSAPSEMEPQYWCKSIDCNPNLDCPDELKIYDNDGNFVACQSICNAIAGMETNYDAGKYVGVPMKDENGKQVPANFTGALKNKDPTSYELLQKMFLQKY